MILLVTASKRGLACSAMLEKALGEPVKFVPNFQRAAAQLSKEAYRAIVLDEALAQADLDGMDIMLNTAGNAVPVYVNLAISNTERVTREVRYSLRQQAELRILLSTELVLRLKDLPPEAQEKLKTVCQLASRIRTRLEGSGSDLHR